MMTSRTPTEKIVAWLRDGPKPPYKSLETSIRASLCSDIADAIERGDHNRYRGDDEANGGGQ